MCVLQADQSIVQEKWENDGDWGQKALRQHPEGKMRATCIEAGQTIGHQRTDETGQDSRRYGDNDAIYETSKAVVGEQSGCVMDQRWLLWEPHRRHREVIVARQR